MKPNTIIKKAKELQEKAKKKKEDNRYQKTIGFLKAKGLLIDEHTKPKPNVKLDIKDVLWVAEKLEPRVLEVLPAALLHFPKTFYNTAALPTELKEIIEAIRLQNTLEKNYKGIEFKKMNFWANKALKDRRVKPTAELKIPKNYRFKPATIEKLQEMAKAANLTETQYLENLIAES